MTHGGKGNHPGIILKESGIIINYLVLMIGLYAWDLKAAYIILSFVCEYVIVILIVSTLMLWQGKSMLINMMSFLQILVGGFGLLALQALMLFFLANKYDNSSGWDESMRSLAWIIPAICLSMLIFHLLPLRHLRDMKERMIVKRSNLFTISIGFLVMVFSGLMTMELADPSSIKPIMVVMILCRMMLEIYMNHFQKEEPKRK